MLSRFRLVPMVPVLFLLACDGGADPVGVDRNVPLLNKGGAVAHAAGGGIFNAGVPVHFSFNAVGFASGDATGQLHFTTAVGGLAIEFKGKVICMATDPVTNRAWVGGVITENRSEHPSFTTAIHAVGKDIWFRLVDYGAPGHGTPDRTTFVGFEGGGGILTSLEYCALRIWPDGDARTNPLTDGNLTVR